MSKETIIRPKHREVLKKTLENRGVSRAQAMREVGYQEGYIKDNSIIDTDSWQELMRTFLPDELLAERHKELLNKREIKRIFNHELGEWIDTQVDVPETQAVSKGLEMAYKLKRKYPTEEGGNKTLIINITGETARRFGLASIAEDNSA
mgnify:FL=1